MNLNFFGLTTKIVLPLFMLIGLFLLSASSINAQFVSPNMGAKIIDDHLTKLPPRTASIRAVGQALSPQMIDEEMNSLRHRFGQSVLKELLNGVEVADAIDKTYNIAKDRIDGHGTPEMVEYLDVVKNEYVELLTD
ncbi:MAG TPA: hypothetical protein ENI82_05825 [Bacteroidetes bacterium]|nr:hypothetical protein [Bacteroidota bacterium]